MLVINCVDCKWGLFINTIWYQYPSLMLI